MSSLQGRATENHKIEVDWEEVRGVLELLVGVPCLGPSSAERDHQGGIQGMRVLLLAISLRDGRRAPLEALRKPRLSWEEEAMKCPICGREAKDLDLCDYHSAAKARVQASYPLWVKAYGRIEWKDYLDNVKRNVQTGQWAKEIAEFLQGG